MGEATGEKMWGKFHAIFGADLKVGFETTFLKEVILNLNPLYEKSGLIHTSIKELVKRVRVYEPAIEVRGSCVDGEAAQVFFEPVSQTSSLFRRLVFARKVSHHTQKPRCWMVAARHGEVSHFGFDSWNSRGQRYLSLVYSGTSEFVPVYIKIQDGKEGSFIYLEVWAWNDGGKIVVQGRRVEANEVPELLHSVKP